MIKKLLWSVIWILTLFWFSYWFQFFDVSLDKIPSYWNSNYEIWVLKKWDFITNYLNTSKGVFWYTDKLFIWWFGGSLYWYDYTSSLNAHSETKNLQWFVQYYRSCDSLFSSGDAFSNCSALQQFDFYDEVITNYLWSMTYGDMVYFDYWWDYNSCGYQCHYYQYQGNLCFSHSWFDSSLCFYVSEMNRTLSSHPSVAPLKDSLWLSDNLTMWSIPYDYIWRSPAVDVIWNSTGGTVVSWNIVTNETTYNDLITYYEQSPFYKYDKKICYVWTNDLTSVYTDWIRYYEWKWKNIFELYNHLYWTWNTWIHEVSTFINSWWINYMTWFEWENRDHNGDVMYNSVYTTTWSYLIWDNLTNPFLTNLSAIYFMASNVTSYWSYATQWEDIATYCYYKLWTSEEDWFENNWLTNITDDSNPVLRQNAGIWSEVVNKTYNEYRADYQLPSQDDNFGDYNSWFWSKLGVYDNTWQKVDFSSSFKSFYSKFTEKLDQATWLSTSWRIPDYILWFLVLIVLFHILKKE